MERVLRGHYLWFIALLERASRPSIADVCAHLRNSIGPRHPLYLFTISFSKAACQTIVAGGSIKRPEEEEFSARFYGPWDFSSVVLLSGEWTSFWKMLVWRKYGHVDKKKKKIRNFSISRNIFHRSIEFSKGGRIYLRRFVYLYIHEITFVLILDICNLEFEKKSAIIARVLASV